MKNIPNPRAIDLKIIKTEFTLTVECVALAKEGGENGSVRQ
ncbi:MAG TPA: hypothetical protein VKH45_11250 [Candidatus Acidoferrum sp.]|nr:hypothetical protein [Candidatus Acidoferrum sp.]